MMRFLLLLLLVFPAFAAGGEELPPGYDAMFLGHTRDEVIAYMGSPSRSTKLDNGMRLMEYRARNTFIYGNKPRKHMLCTFRLWISGSTVERIEAEGDALTCRVMIHNKGQPRDWTTDLRYP